MGRETNKSQNVVGQKPLGRWAPGRPRHRQDHIKMDQSEVSYNEKDWI
jgi:hypothetical protein